ncbi:fungal specific transcription factor domain-containing protein [Aspergillus stella-maris]|uniref:fungal specific transcription factor domain-containing protein n=1 Tax=Aspergillus stella-maris TaxID=1810926 RepID=UPI003CCCE20E
MDLEAHTEQQQSQRRFMPATMHAQDAGTAFVQIKACTTNIFVQLSRLTVNGRLRASDIDNEALLRRIAFLEIKLQVNVEGSVVDDEASVDTNQTVSMSKGREDTAFQPPPQNDMDNQTRHVDAPLTPSTSSQWIQPQSLSSAAGNSPTSLIPPAIGPPSLSRAMPNTTPDMQDHALIPLTAFPRDQSRHGSSCVPVRKYNGHRDENSSPVDALSTTHARSYHDTYLSYVHPQYPFLNKAELNTLCRPWTQGTSAAVPGEMTTLERCIIFLVFSIGALIFDGNTRQRPSQSEVLHSYAEEHYLPEIFSKPDLMGQTTILLLLAMRDLHCSSSNTIIQHASAAVRTAITAGLHRHPSQSDAASSADPRTEQMRRRLWWCCYGLDRGVALAFGHPISISDDFITVEARHFQKVKQDEQTTLLNGEDDDVSCALHLTAGRKIQSRIITTFYTSTSKRSTDQALDRMRSQFCQELEEWQATVMPMTEDKPGYGGRNWFRMIAYYSLLGLVSGYNSTLSNGRQAVGAVGRTVVACCNACITYQQISRSRQVAPSWLALVSQFQAGVTILYCFWTTPPAMRTEEFELSYASRGVRICSNNLVLLAERWAEGEVYRDAFDILSKAVSLSHDEHPMLTNRRLSTANLADLERLTQEVKHLGAHFRAVEMVEEILRAQRPSRRLAQQPMHLPPLAQDSAQVQGFDYPGLHGWDNEHLQASTTPDLYDPGHLGLGDLWTDPMNHIYS